MSARTIAAATAPTTVGRTVLGWLPTFVGYPLGGLAAELLVGRIDDTPAALAGGALTGAVLGAVQAWRLRRDGVAVLPWVAATALGLAAGLGAGAGLVDHRTTMASLAVQGLVSGGAVGVAQAVVLVRRFGAVAWAWPIVLGGLWALGWTVTTAVGVDVEAQYSVFGSTGALVVTLATSVLAVALGLNRARPAGGPGARRRGGR
jgi:hypothetical protein